VLWLRSIPSTKPDIGRSRPPIQKKNHSIRATFHTAWATSRQGAWHRFHDRAGAPACSRCKRGIKIKKCLFRAQADFSDEAEIKVGVSHLCAQTYAIENETAIVAKHTMANINAATPVLSRPSALWPWELRSHKTADCLGDALLIGQNDLAQVLRVHTRRKCRRTDEVREHHREPGGAGERC
jgi:hypothetical protein